MRRPSPPLNGAQYCANKSPSSKEVHDLDNENTNCQIDEILKAGNAVPYNSLSEAKAAGYDNCHWCLGGSKR